VPKNHPIPPLSTIHDIVTRWAARHDARVEGCPPALDHWLVRPANAPDGGTICVALRHNEHGPLEVAPSNDRGWFERYGTTPRELPRILDLARADVFSWSGDPGQGMP